jgi:hypothetical protein
LGWRKLLDVAFRVVGLDGRDFVYLQLFQVEVLNKIC